MASEKKQSVKESKAAQLAYQKAQDWANEAPIRRKQRAIYRQMLAQYEPVPFDILNKAVSKQRLSHAYLFTGPKGSLKTELAILLSQTILLGKNELVNEEMLSDAEMIFCENIATNNHPDYYFLNGYRKEAISKEEIDSIPIRFAQKAVSAAGKKVYVIDHFENTSISAMNSMLKFLEEPSDNVYAIIIADNVERILPTIVSRCVQLRFQPLPTQLYYDLARKQGVDLEDAYLLSHIEKSIDHFAEVVVSDSFQNAKKMLKQWIGADGDRRLLLVDYEVHYQAKKASSEKSALKQAKDINLDTIRYFLDMMICFYKDILLYDGNGPAWYDSAIQKQYFATKYIAKCIEILVQQRDLCNRINDLNLVLAQTIYRLGKEVQ